MYKSSNARLVNSEEQELTSTYRMTSNSSILLAVLSPFLVSRIIIFLILFLSSAATLDSVPAREGRTWHVSFSNFETTIQEMKMTLLSADASWYMEIAQFGYPEADHTSEKAQHWVFFPGYPLLTHCISYLVPSWLAAGLLVNSLLFLIALFFLYAVTLKITNDKLAARNTTYLASFHPLSYFFTSPFTESLFFCTLCGAFFAIKTRYRWALSLCLALCLISRPTGLLVLPGVLWWMKEEKYPLRDIITACLAALIPFLLFCVHLNNLTGSPFVWMENQGAWGRAVGDVSLFERIYLLSGELVFYKPWSFNAIHITSLLMGLGISVAFFKKHKMGWCLIMLIPIFAAISTGSLLSLTRILMPLPPLYIATATWLRKNDALFLSILLTCAACLGVMTLLYSLHVSLAMT